MCIISHVYDYAQHHFVRLLRESQQRRKAQREKVAIHSRGAIPLCTIANNSSRRVLREYFKHRSSSLVGLSDSSHRPFSISHKRASEPFVYGSTAIIMVST